MAVKLVMLSDSTLQTPSFNTYTGHPSSGHEINREMTLACEYCCYQDTMYKGLYGNATFLN